MDAKKSVIEIWRWVVTFAHEYLHPIIIWAAVLAFVERVLSYLFGESPIAFVVRQFEFSGLVATRLVDMHPALFAVLIVALCVSLAMTLVRARRFRRSARQALEIIQKSTREHAVFIQTIAELLSRRPNNDSADVIDDVIVEYLRDLCDDVSDAFSKLTRGQCCTSVKSFDKSTGLISTYSRDRRSFHRAIADETLPAYHYATNTAFLQILDTASVNFFFSNRLRLLAAFGHYSNENLRWRRYYRATCVMPICASAASENINADTVTGFLCVDNFVGHFWGDQAEALLAIYSQFVLAALEITSTID